MSSVNPDRSRAAPLGSWLVMAAAGGAASGIATSYLQGVLPDPVNFVANSGAVWVLIAFLLALPVVRRQWGAALAGASALLAEVIGYYAIASPIRHVVTSNAERLLWVVAALVIGPIVGLAAYQNRRGTPPRRLVALAVIVGVVGGEGVYAALTLGDVVRGSIEIAVAATAMFVALLRVPGASWHAKASAPAAAALTAAIVFLAYHL